MAPPPGDLRRVDLTPPPVVDGTPPRTIAAARTPRPRVIPWVLGGGAVVAAGGAISFGVVSSGARQRWNAALVTLPDGTLGTRLPADEARALATSANTTLALSISSAILSPASRPTPLPVAEPRPATPVGETVYGAWSACAYSSACATSGQRTRSVTVHTCQASACASNTTTETDTTSCGRVTQGTTCATAQVTYGACSYADACVYSGSRSQTTTTFACNASGACVGTPVSGTDTAGCSRNTNGDSCGTTHCGVCGACNVDCERLQTCTSYTCGSGTCNSSNSAEICGDCPDTCVPR